MIIAYYQAIGVSLKPCERLPSNWRGEPLKDYETVIKLISKTATAKGLKVRCRLDRRKYPTGRKVTVEEMNKVNMKCDTFHGEWNYIIKPGSNYQLLPLGMEI